ncbi:hypothetical protein F4813DRAFT_183714 [Daldinia decipiens]|uniref:uncharacterized protein n=1 Tax=Daldinia decipiens TaxID=326647 RepID=UPI0020C3EE6F|nr:uncharacterized protein F4813DRAFT_183714 [Daldinia decipiens]KAI1655175.1 hypothetical protein F4813DRAFT_183714 [Daldinia decipiens]
MHLISPKAIEIDSNECDGHKFKAYCLRFLSPPNKATCPVRRYWFSLYYTIAHVFPIMNTLIYWGCLVPSGHGGFKAPTLPYHPQNPPYNNDTETIRHHPDKGLFDQAPINIFSIINVWTITTVIALVEICFLNSIRRQTPIICHAIGVTFCSGAYLAWSGFGKLVTGHSGLFFLDPEIIEVPEAIIAACIAFVAISPGIFTYMYGLIAMRETITAVRHDSSC